jgi:hypothetical protein
MHVKQDLLLHFFFTFTLFTYYCGDEGGVSQGYAPSLAIIITLCYSMYVRFHHGGKRFETQASQCVNYFMYPGVCSLENALLINSTTFGKKHSQ